MGNLNILLCSGDKRSLNYTAKRFKEAGLSTSASSNLTDAICQPHVKYDLLIIDMDSLNSFLRGLLPSVRRVYPQLPMVGLLRERTDKLDKLTSEFGLDYCFRHSAAPEEILTQFPNLMRKIVHTKYLVSRKSDVLKEIDVDKTSPTTANPLSRFQTATLKVRASNP